MAASGQEPTATSAYSTTEQRILLGFRHTCTRLLQTALHELGVGVSRRSSLAGQPPEILRKTEAVPKGVFAAAGMTVAEVIPSARFRLPSIVFILTRAIQITGVDGLGLSLTGRVNMRALTAS